MERRRLLEGIGGGLLALSVSGCAGLDTGAASERTTERTASNRSAGTQTSVSETASSAAAGGDRQFSRFESYSGHEAVVRVVPDDLPNRVAEDFRIAVFTRSYPRGTAVGGGISERVRNPAGEAKQVRIELDDESIPARNHATSTPSLAHHVAEIRPGWVGDGAHRPDMGPVIAETDRFRRTEAGEIEAAPHPDAVASEREGSFERRETDGAYEIQVSARDDSWTAVVRAFKSSYVRAVETPRVEDYPPYVRAATESGLAGHLATETITVAERRNQDPIEFAIDFVQALPYVPETVTAGLDEYVKYPVETLVDGGGDCEDSAILLAAILQAPQYGLDCALIHPPNHMGLGISSDSYGGTFYPYEGERYFYVETTGSGWAIGELPEEYGDTTALVYQV